MDELIRESLQSVPLTPTISLLELLAAILLATVLNFVLAYVYMATHRGYSYSKAYVHTIVLVGVTITLIMVIIGSNIARAFALVGAMSIVRFRNPVKDPRDIVFIFMAMAVGMACGTFFYSFAVVFTLFAVALIGIFHLTSFGDMTHQTYVLKMRLRPDAKELVSGIFERTCTNFAVISIDRPSPDQPDEDVVYEINLGKKSKYDDVVRELVDRAQVSNVNLLIGESNISV